MSAKQASIYRYRLLYIQGIIPFYIDKMSCCGEIGSSSAENVVIKANASSKSLLIYI